MLIQLLEFASVLSAGVISGAMIYESIVEVGVRKNTPPVDQLANWHRCFPVASGIFKPLGFITAALFAITGYVTADYLWFIAALVAFLLGPITWLLIAPTNTRLLAMKEKTDGSEISDAIAKWGARHHLRTTLITISFVLSLYIVIVR
ncbi:MAG: DUF1772 domain-containing protein [Parasphingorhabdus sp.]|uniref:DUF1772 domain-containing protein n=1 Tax=Parasphingorhabdus sp. TaxID=2709688 RepID=UPI003297C742